MTGGGVVQAAGAVLWRPTVGGGEPEVLVLHRPKYDDWSLPKGKLDPGEHVVVGAVREVHEETGHTVRLGRPLRTQHYTVRAGPKEVRYWAACTDDTAAAWPGTAEVDRLEMLPAREALERLTYERDAPLIRDLLELPAVTTPLVVLRHADAEPRRTWTGPDLERPLHPNGERLAAALVPVLSAFGPTRLVSSDTVRCAQSLEPYATSRQLPIDLEPHISEEGAEHHPGAVAGVVQRLIDDEVPAVLCTHRQLLDAVRQTLRKLAAPGVHVPDDKLVPGGFLVAHAAGGRVVAVEQHDP